jgi:hypothetical protein
LGVSEAAREQGEVATGPSAPNAPSAANCPGGQEQERAFDRLGHRVHERQRHGRGHRAGAQVAECPAEAGDPRLVVDRAAGRVEVVAVLQHPLDAGDDGGRLGRDHGGRSGGVGLGRDRAVGDATIEELGRAR